MKINHHEKWPAIGLVHLALDCIGTSTLDQIVEFLNVANNRITKSQAMRALHQLRFEGAVLAIIEKDNVHYRLRTHG